MASCVVRNRIGEGFPVLPAFFEFFRFLQDTPLQLARKILELAIRMLQLNAHHVGGALGALLITNVPRDF